VKHEPTKIALLVSLICAGVSPAAFGKVEARSEAPHQWRESSPTNAPTAALDLAAPLAWPHLLSGLSRAKPGDFELVLLASTTHEFSEAKPRAQGANQVIDATLANAVESTDTTGTVDAVDPLELANASAVVDVVVHAMGIELIGPALTAHPQAQPRLRKLDKTSRANVQAPAAVITPLKENEANAVVTPPIVALEAPLQRRLEKHESEGQAAAASAPIGEPSLAAPAHIEKVWATLNAVLAPASTAGPEATGDADEVTPEEAIAARRELKRMKQRMREHLKESLKQEQRAQAISSQDAAAVDLPPKNDAARMTATAVATPAEPAPPTRVNPFGSQRVAVHENALDRVRGGFVTPSLNISFGIERAVYINGALVTTTSLNVTDLGRVTSGIATKLTDPGALALIQNGAGNSVASGAFSTNSGAGAGVGSAMNANAVGTIVQNTLDGQKIQNVTVINATANSLGVLRDLNLQNSLRNSLIDSLRR
jgi:hypothetical protein